MSVTNLINYNYSIVNSLYRISYIIGYTGPSELVAKEMHFFVSYLIPHIVQIPKVMTLLEEIAERHVTEKEDLLKTHFPVSNKNLCTILRVIYHFLEHPHQFT